MTTFEQILNNARFAYRAQFKKMAASGERFALALLPVTPQRPVVGVIIEPQGAIDSSIYPGAHVMVSDIQGKTEQQTIAILDAKLRSFPIYF